MFPGLETEEMHEKGREKSNEEQMNGRIPFKNV
jgi:hypothetical protein